MNSKASAFDTGLCPEIRQILKCFDELRPAIWVATVINRVYAQKNVTGLDHFRPGKRVREKDCVACGNVRDRNAVRDFCFRTLLRHIDIVGERGAAKDAEVDLCDAMLSCA